MTEIHDQWTVFYEKRKKYPHFVFKQAVAVEYWCEKKKILYFQLNNLWFPFPIWSKENISFHSWQ